ncbi:hypothetical protein EJB05_03827, partial [Eragrostis curvula]
MHTAIPQQQLSEQLRPSSSPSFFPKILGSSTTYLSSRPLSSSRPHRPSAAAALGSAGIMTKHPRDGGDVVTLSLSLALGGEAERARKQPRRADGEFVCKTCSRAFASFQALGGHRTSHLRGRHGLALGLQQAAAAPNKAAAANKENKLAAATTHECHVCGQGFEMGQALGGHMRRHRDEITAVAARHRPFCFSSLCRVRLFIRSRRYP